MNNMIGSVLATFVILNGVSTNADNSESSTQPLTKTVVVQGRALLANSFETTLYVFDPDQDAAKPNCYGTCAEKWPPYLLSKDEEAMIVEPFSTVTRTTGLNQLQFRGRPVYTFFLDRTSGDIKGNGLGGVWHVISVD